MGPNQMDKPTFMDIANELYELHKAKSGDYGNEADYFPFGETSYVQMLHIKAKRLVSLAQQTDEPINFESTEDTVKDLVNYGIFFLNYLRKLKNE